jgi:hypothetical protein
MDTGGPFDQAFVPKKVDPTLVTLPLQRGEFLRSDFSPKFSRALDQMVSHFVFGTPVESRSARVQEKSAMNEPTFISEEVTDPVEIARHRAQAEQAKRNSAWLQAHWADVLPQARGKFLAVAGQEAFIADTPGQAWSWADQQHPEDRGALVLYVISEGGPRLYENRGGVVILRRPGHAPGRNR